MHITFINYLKSLIINTLDKLIASRVGRSFATSFAKAKLTFWALRASYGPSSLLILAPAGSVA